MKRNSPEAIVGWMVIISNLGLSWFFLGEGEKPETNSFRNHKAWKGENETQQSGGDFHNIFFHLVVKSSFPSEDSTESTSLFEGIVSSFT